MNRYIAIALCLIFSHVAYSALVVEYGPVVVQTGTVAQADAGNLARGTIIIDGNNSMRYYDGTTVGGIFIGGTNYNFEGYIHNTSNVVVGTDPADSKISFGATNGWFAGTSSDEEYFDLTHYDLGSPAFQVRSNGFLYASGATNDTVSESLINVGQLDKRYLLRDAAKSTIVETHAMEKYLDMGGNAIANASLLGDSTGTILLGFSSGQVAFETYGAGGTMLFRSLLSDLTLTAGGDMAINGTTIGLNGPVTLDSTMNFGGQNATNISDIVSADVASHISMADGDIDIVNSGGHIFVDATDISIGQAGSMTDIYGGIATYGALGNDGTGTLGGFADPTAGTHIGDRDYNDIRYSLKYAAVKTTLTNYVVGTDDTDEYAGGVIYASGNLSVTAEPVAAGASFTVKAMGTGLAVNVIPDGLDVFWLNGVQLDEFHQISSPTNAGAVATFIGMDGGNWDVTTSTGWTDGGVP